MHILLKNVKIIAPSSPLHGQQKDISIQNGINQQVADNLEDARATVISGNNLHVSAGWMDVFAHFCDPGQEHKIGRASCRERV